MVDLPHAAASWFSCVWQTAAMASMVALGTVIAPVVSLWKAMIPPAFGGMWATLGIPDAVGAPPPPPPPRTVKVADAWRDAVSVAVMVWEPTVAELGTGAVVE